MTIYWPSELPQKLNIDQFGTAPNDGRVRTSMETGPPKVRRRTTAMPRPLTGDFLSDADGYARVLRFWRDELEGGVLPFLLPEQLMDEATLLTEDSEEILTEDDEELLIDAWWTVQFVEPPQVRMHASGIITGVALNLIILP